MAGQRSNGSRAGPDSRSLLLTILGEYVAGSGPVWTGTLVRALGALGVQEKAARQALARSAADGWLAGERVGRRVRYSLSSNTHRMLVEGARRIYSFGEGADWDGRWLVLVVSVPEDQRSLRHRLRTSLSWVEFGPLGQGVWISPGANREDEAAEVVASLGPGVQAASFVGHHASLGDEIALVARAWDLPALERRYRDFLDDFSTRRPGSGAATFAAQTRLVHEWRRFPLVDPGLPESLLPGDWPGRRARDVFARRHREWTAAARAWFWERDVNGGGGSG